MNRRPLWSTDGNLLHGWHFGGGAFVGLGVIQWWLPYHLRRKFKRIANTQGSDVVYWIGGVQ